MLAGPGPTPRREQRVLWRLRRVLFLFGLFCVGGLITAIAVLSRIELQDDDFGSLAQTTFVCSADITRSPGAECDTDVAMAQFSAGEDREIVAYDQIPEVLISAVVATEDKDFFEHEGVDPLGIARALYQDVRERSASQGGSTITQQYVKLTYVGNERNLVRKVREATLAIKLERELANDYQGIGAKQEILRRYLNRIYFGRGAYGVQAAAQNYFGKNVEEVSLPEAAFLAGLIRSPNSADPHHDPDEAERRMNVTLTRMVEDGSISPEESAVAAATDLAAITIAESDRTGPVQVRGAEGSDYFVEAVRQELAELYPDGGLYTKGLRVYTTLDPALQQAAFTSVSEVVDPRVNPDDPSASLVAVDDRGRVVAMMGGYDFSTSQVNLATGRDGGGSGRQPGSSFKPFALAAAIEAGISADSFYPAPSTISLEGANNGADWVVSGGGSNEGYRSLADAMRVSSNVVYAQLMVQLTPSAVVEMAHRLGVRAELEPVNALVLGSGEVSVLDMAAAFSTFADQGDQYDPVLIERIELPDGTTCWFPRDGRCGQGPDRLPDLAGALDGSIARQVTYAMSEVITSGTGRAAAFGRDAAGKTGTTQDARDAWFVGYTCNLTAAVWMGYTGGPGEPVRPMENVQGIEVHGGDFPAEIWSAFMTRATEAAPPCELPMESDFTGDLLNSELSTTTTLPFCEPIPEAVPGEGESTESTTPPSTEPCQERPPESTTTTVEGDPGTTTVPDPNAAPTTTAPDDATPPTPSTTAPTTVPTGD